MPRTKRDPAEWTPPEELDRAEVSDARLRVDAKGVPRASVRVSLPDGRKRRAQMSWRNPARKVGKGFGVKMTTKAGKAAADRLLAKMDEKAAEMAANPAVAKKIANAVTAARELIEKDERERAAARRKGLMEEARVALSLLNLSQDEVLLLWKEATALAVMDS